MELYLYNLCTAIPWLRRLVAKHRSIQVGFVVEVGKVAQGQVSLQVFRISPVSIIPPLLHIHSFIRRLLGWLVFSFFRSSTTEGIFFSRHDSPLWARASSLLRHHYHRHTTIGRNPLNE